MTSKEDEVGPQEDKDKVVHKIMNSKENSVAPQDDKDKVVPQKNKVITQEDEDEDEVVNYRSQHTQEYDVVAQKEDVVPKENNNKAAIQVSEVSPAMNKAQVIPTSSDKDQASLVSSNKAQVSPASSDKVVPMFPLEDQYLAQDLLQNGINTFRNALSALDNVCSGPREEVVSLDLENNDRVNVDGTFRTVIGAKEIAVQKKKGLWVTFNKEGKFAIMIPYFESHIIVPISFCTIDDIHHVLSYRWAGAYGQKLVGNDAPIDFLNISTTEKVWVDYLNHLNQDELKQGVIENMGALYSKRPVMAKYLLDFKKEDGQVGVSKMLSCITRGWIWQELAFTDSEIIPPNAKPLELIVELIKAGAEIVRGIIVEGYFEPKKKIDTNEVIKFAIDVIWRARNLADNESAHNFFITNEWKHKYVISEAIATVKKIGRVELCHPAHFRLLAALDNLENANFTLVKDGFAASFSTLLQTYPDMFGTTPSGSLAPEGFNRTVTTILREISKKQTWDFEWWQQCNLDHPLSQLCHPKIISITINRWKYEIEAEGGKKVMVEKGYHKSLQADSLGKNDPVEGKYEIRNLSYRIQRGKIIIIGFQTICGLRFVSCQGIQVTDEDIEIDPDPKNCSRRVLTSWHSMDADWMKVLNENWN